MGQGSTHTLLSCQSELDLPCDMDTTGIHSRLLLWFLLLAGCAAQFSPCPFVFNYQSDGSIEFSVKPPQQRGRKIHLQVRLYTSSNPAVKDDEGLILLGDKRALNKRLLTGSQAPIKYKLPLTSRVTAVVKDVMVNHKIVCENNISNALKFEINLEHVFLPEGELSLRAPLHLELGVECGLTSELVPFIHRGETTVPGQWPWHTALYLQERNSLSYRCGGTLITWNAVVTAAHCVTDNRGDGLNPRKITVYLGKYQLYQWDEGVQGKEVKTIYVHPDYNRLKYHNDIAILRLRVPASKSVFVRPACVWGREDLNHLEIVGKLGSVIGWGRNEQGSFEDELKLGRIPVVEIRECLTSYEAFNVYSTNKTFCAGFRNGSFNPCDGDSGGGMFFRASNSEEWLLRGVVSNGASRIGDGVVTCDPMHYTIFTDVMAYSDWIYRTVMHEINKDG